MDTSVPAKSYVVYNGRKPGVYTLWIDCYAQVNGWNDSVVRLYDSKQDGDMAWNSYCNSTSTSLRKKPEIERAINVNHGYSCEIIDAMGVPRGSNGRVKERPRAKVLIEQSMQNLLRNACFQMRIQLPLYTLHDVKDFDSRQHYRYRGSIANKTQGKPPVSLGNYARTEYDAREDVVVLLLRRLLSCNGKIIVDYNQHNIKLLEDQLLRASEFNFELRMENAVLTEELRLLRNQIRSDNE